MKKILDNIKKIEKLDSSNMHELLINFPKAILDAQAISARIKLPSEYKRNYSSIVFSGVGGSAIGADFIRSYLEDEIHLPIIVNRDYTVPALVGEKTLFIVSSYSGNTEETLSSFELAQKKTSNIIALSSNGKLMDSAIKKKIPFIRVPGGMPPRAALAYGTIPFLILFTKLGLISSKSDEIKEASKVLGKLAGELKPDKQTKNNLAKKIALSCVGKLPVIYGASRNVGASVTRLRGQLAENSKVLASTHLFPEMNHNEIVGWENPKKLLSQFVVLFLKDKNDHPRVKLRMDITKSIIKKSKAKIIEIDSVGKTLLSRLFSLIYIGDWVSFYLAVLNNVDPTPVDQVTYLKKKMAE